MSDDKGKTLESLRSLPDIEVLGDERMMFLLDIGNYQARVFYMSGNAFHPDRLDVLIDRRGITLAEAIAALTPPQPVTREWLLSQPGAVSIDDAISFSNGDLRFFFDDDDKLIDVLLYRGLIRNPENTAEALQIFKICGLVK